MQFANYFPHSIENRSIITSIQNANYLHFHHLFRYPRFLEERRKQLSENWKKKNTHFLKDIKELRRTQWAGICMYKTVT